MEETKGKNPNNNEQTKQISIKTKHTHTHIKERERILLGIQTKLKREKRGTEEASHSSRSARPVFSDRKKNK